MVLINCAYRLDITDKERLKTEFENLSRVITSLTIYRLTFPRDLSRLPAVQEAILEHLSVFARNSFPSSAWNLLDHNRLVELRLAIASTAIIVYSPARIPVHVVP